MYTIQDLFDLSHTRAAAYLAGFTYPWEALAGIGDLIRQLGPTLEPDFAQRAPEVWVHKTAVVAPSAAPIVSRKPSTPTTGVGWIAVRPVWL